MRMTRLVVPSSDLELASDRLWSIGARAVEERTVDPARVELRTVLADDDRISTELLGALPDGWELTFADEDPTPAETWRQFARPIEVSERLTIRPAWIPSAERPGVLDISIEPAGSFGLGDHPTTRLSADLVDQLVQPGDAVLDVGCGSGVLSLIAARRGAGRVVAIDISEPARAATVRNAEANDVRLDEVSTRPVSEIMGEFDLVVANILAPELVALSAELRRVTAAAGCLVVSGLLAERDDAVVEALAPMRVVDRRVLDGWSALVLVEQRPDR